MADVITITRVSALKGLKALVKEYGEHSVYPQSIDPKAQSCVYVRDGEPSCMIGKLLAAAGVPLERLERADTVGGTPAFNLVHQLADEGVIDAQSGVDEMLSAAQSAQDFGDTWGNAYKTAARYL